MGAGVGADANIAALAAPAGKAVAGGVDTETVAVTRVTTLLAWTQRDRAIWSSEARIAVAGHLVQVTDTTATAVHRTASGAHVHNREGTSLMRTVIARVPSLTLAAATIADAAEGAVQGTVGEAVGTSEAGATDTVSVYTGTVTNTERRELAGLDGAILSREAGFTEAGVLVTHTAPKTVIGTSGTGTGAAVVARVTHAHSTLLTLPTPVTSFGTVGLGARWARPKLVADTPPSNTRPVRTTVACARDGFVQNRTRTPFPAARTFAATADAGAMKATVGIDEAQGLGARWPRARLDAVAGAVETGAVVVAVVRTGCEGAVEAGVARVADAGAALAHAVTAAPVDAGGLSTASAICGRVAGAHGRQRHRHLLLCLLDLRNLSF